jgi:hypothetical protein
MIRGPAKEDGQTPAAAPNVLSVLSLIQHQFNCPTEWTPREGTTPAFQGLRAGRRSRIRRDRVWPQPFNDPANDGLVLRFKGDRTVGIGVFDPRWACGQRPQMAWDLPTVLDAQALA